MAVTAQDEAPFLVLDDDDRIVEVGSAAAELHGSLVGHRLWDRYPDSEPLFRPHYERARRCDEPTEFVQFHRGQVAWVRAVPRVFCGEPALTVHWRILLVLDTLTLDGLRSSLSEALDLLAAWEVQARRRLTRERLRVIEGGR